MLTRFQILQEHCSPIPENSRIFHNISEDSRTLYKTLEIQEYF